MKGEHLENLANSNLKEMQITRNKCCGRSVVLVGSTTLALLALITWILSGNRTKVYITENVTQIESDAVYLIADPSILSQYFNKESSDPLTLYQSRSPLIDDRCIHEVSNDYGIYCPDLSLFCTRSQDLRNGTFQYFSNWYGNLSSNYKILPGGKIQVGSSGKYKIHANVHWKTENDILMRLLKVDVRGRVSIINDECKKVRDPERREPTDMKCVISNVTTVLESEVIYLGFKCYSPIVVRKGWPSLHVMKVDDKI